VLLCRSLLRKRSEVAELRVSSKQLKQQLKAKRRGVDALEEMLKEANRNNANARRKAQRGEQPEAVEAAPARGTELLKFFVSGPEGLCVEFQSKGSSTVRDLKREVREAFRSGEGAGAGAEEGTGDAGRGWSGDGLIRLLRHGRVMVDDSTLQENGLRSGDTVVALVDRPRAQAPPAAAAAAPADDRTQLMLAFMGKQQDSIAGMTSEMRQGWEAVVQALTHKGGDAGVDVNKDLLLRMEDRWSRMEASFREGLDSSRQQQEAAPRRKCRAGDLESDHEYDENMAHEMNSKLRWSSTKISHLEMETAGVQEAFKRMQEQHSKDMGDIRSLLMALRPQEQEQAQARSGAAEVAAPAPKKESRWNGVVAAATALPAEKEEEEEEEEEEPAPAPRPAAKQLAKPKPKAEQPLSSHVTISFHKKFSKSLADFFIDKVEVEVARDVSLDDLIFELRREVAEQADVMLARVTLALNGQEIALGIDVAGGRLSPASAADMAARGELVVRVSADRPVTDAQLDVLVAQMERSQSLSRSREGGLAERERERPANPATARRSLDIYKQSLRYSSGGESQPEDSRDAEEELREEELWWTGEASGGGGGGGRGGIAGSPSRKSLSGDLSRSLGSPSVAAARQSLDSLLRTLNERDGMTDDEVQHEVRQLRRSAGSMSPSANARLKTIERGIVGAVSAAADSGSEDIHDDSDGGGRDRGRGQGQGQGAQMRTAVRGGGGDGNMDASLLRLSHSWMSGTGGSLIVSQEGSTRRVYDAPDAYRAASREEERDGPLTRSVDTPDFNYDDEDSRDSVSRHHARLGGSGGHSGDRDRDRDHMMAGGTASSMGSMDLSHTPGYGQGQGQGQGVDLERTVDTDISMPLDESPRARAQQYEDDAAGDRIAAFDDEGEEEGEGEGRHDDMRDIRVPVTPSPSRVRGAGGAGAGPLSAGNMSTGSGSPFFHMGDETNDGGSLALSESHDTFADLDGSSKSIIDYRK
jgi:hypothetical protein